MDGFDLLSIATGREAVRTGDSPDLEKDPELWREVWEGARAEVLAYWVEQHPGGRPPAWWEFDADHYPECLDDESEPEYLARIGVLSSHEIGAMTARAKSLAEFNARYPRDDPHWIEPGDGERFVAARGLLSPAEREALGFEPRNGHAYINGVVRSVRH